MELVHQFFGLIQQFIEIVFHLDVHLAHLMDVMGAGIYIVLFLIVFCETGLVVTPFLPGDSLLFATGALAAIHPESLNIWLLSGSLLIAAIVGDAVNYSIGARVGPRIFSRERSLLFNPQHLIRAQSFYERHGKKTIIFARFIPILRTFAPFVAGIGKMPYRAFFAFNVIGAFSWIFIFLFGGYQFGELPIVKERFHLVIIGIIFVSALPGAIEIYRSMRRERNSHVVI